MRPGFCACDGWCSPDETRSLGPCVRHTAWPRQAERQEGARRLAAVAGVAVQARGSPVPMKKPGRPSRALYEPVAFATGPAEFGPRNRTSAPRLRHGWRRNAAAIRDYPRCDRGSEEWLREAAHREACSARACDLYRQTVAQFDALDRRSGMQDFDRNDTYAGAKKSLAGC